MKLLKGTEVVPFIKERQAKQVRNLRQTWDTVPRLAIVQTIDNPVIDTYVRLKRDYAHDIGVEFEHRKVSQNQAVQVIQALNERADVYGIIVQLPLDDMAQAREILAAVDSAKDVDGLNGRSDFTPATPMAIDWLLASYGVELAGKNIAIVGRGRLVGGPLAKLWLSSNYQVQVFDESSENMAEEISQSDVIVSGAGAPGVITSSMIRPGAVVVDAGTTSEGGTIKGDVADEVYQRRDVTITPKTGGVGPLTVAALFENVILAARARLKG